MESDSKRAIVLMKIFYLNECSSTQDVVKEYLKNRKPPFGIVAKKQSRGVGSRGNSWQSDEGNLYFSFCIEQSALAKDIPLASTSIYFAYLLREFLSERGSQIWLKWPNDLFIGDKKIGGVITSKMKDILICGVGLNLLNPPPNAQKLDIKITIEEIVDGFCKKLKFKPLWKEILSKFLLDFEKSKKFSSHIDGNLLTLKEATLCDDGAILINNKKVYSLR